MSCPAQLKGSIEHFVSKAALDIDGFGPKNVEQFIKEGLIKDLADIYSIKDKRDELLELEGWKEKSVDNLIAAIEKSKETKDLKRIIYGLGIRNVGEHTAEVLAEEFSIRLTNLCKADS